MSRRKGKRQRRRSPATLLRPRLDKLWADDALLYQDNATIEADLDVISCDVKPDLLLQAMLRASLSASVRARTRLDGVLPGWLRRHSHLSTLKEMVLDGSLHADLHPQALAWMEAGGIDSQAIVDELRDRFFQAYYFDDVDFVGEKSQATVQVFWYTSQKKNRAQGMVFLLDYNPPWDGSVKDIMVTSRRLAQMLVDGILDQWASREMVLEQISAEEARTVILTALHCNREANLRLPRDLILERETFVRHILSLPDAPDTPPFTIDDFDSLADHGQPPEEVVYLEQTVGRRVRMADGEEVLVMDSLEWEDEEE